MENRGVEKGDNDSHKLQRSTFHFFSKTNKQVWNSLIACTEDTQYQVLLKKVLVWFKMCLSPHYLCQCTSISSYLIPLSPTLTMTFTSTLWPLTLKLLTQQYRTPNLAPGLSHMHKIYTLLIGSFSSRGMVISVDICFICGENGETNIIVLWISRS